mmetsp:Transcript_7511/g.7721  ORF Transcript_7511/g.7721 Transcript_7511/m.7721 type:complete len:117 (-) Transcript_7511:578-928(-)
MYISFRFFWFLIYCHDLYHKNIEADKVLSPEKGSRASGKLLQPPTPIMRGANWATLDVQKTTLEDLEAAEGTRHEDTVFEPSAPSTKQESADAWDDGEFGDGDNLDDDGFGDDDDA